MPNRLQHQGSTSSNPIRIQIKNPRSTSYDSKLPMASWAISDGTASITTMTRDQDSPTPPFPSFEGDVYKRGDPGYPEHCYQYASSSYLSDDIIRPKYIIYPKHDDDVIKAIQYAKATKIAVAIRSGGHQYSGASSTYGDNIQLALSRTYDDFRWEDSDATLVTVGVSYSLSVFNQKLKEKGRFVPHGQCSNVHVGGHVQTGGYGQLGRSFGLFADHVQKLRIITAEGQPIEIQRGVENDKDLFFAVLGGSPGNFGVLTHVTLKVYRDQDHSLSRGFKNVYLYDRDCLKRLLDVLVKMGNDPSFPADYDYCITVLSKASLVNLNPNPAGNLDTKMRIEHPELFGKDGLLPWPAIILVYAQWANLEGSGQIYDGTFFKEIQEAGGHKELDLPALGTRRDELQPLSELTGDWIFQNVREFDMPYVKRVYMSNSKTLEKDGWTDWMCNRIDEIERNPFSCCKLSIQIQNFGGNNSRFYQNGKDGSTSFSWRDSSICSVMDCFYDGSQAAKQTAEEWQQVNDKEVGHAESRFCKEDRRLLWGSHDLNLDPVHEYYYDNNPTKYNRLHEIKNKVDPYGVFTPNGFCVGASPVTRDALQKPASVLAMTVDKDLPISPIPSFEGDVFKRGGPGYPEHCYQYASSSYLSDDIIRPKYIIYPKHDDDVIKAIQYAKATKIAVAVRTGGHQYSGASSTYGDNIQLALSHTYEDFRWENDDATLVTVGVSYSLSVFNQKLKEK
ncbi:hypothetical protein BGX28_000071, partial [Mortierella sp. GBA30]